MSVYLKLFFLSSKSKFQYSSLYGNKYECGVCKNILYNPRYCSVDIYEINSHYCIYTSRCGVLCCVLADVESREDISQAECRPHHPTCRARCAPHRALVTQLASAVRGAARRGGDPDTVFLPASCRLLVAGGCWWLAGTTCSKLSQPGGVTSERSTASTPQLGQGVI